MAEPVVLSFCYRATPRRRRHGSPWRRSTAARSGCDALSLFFIFTCTHSLQCLVRPVCALLTVLETVGDCTVWPRPESATACPQTDVLLETSCTPACPGCHPSACPQTDVLLETICTPACPGCHPSPCMSCQPLHSSSTQLAAFMREGRAKARVPLRGQVYITL